MILRDRYYLFFSMAFSAACHFLCLSLICIVITPNLKIRDQFTEVTFLGPILEKTAFEMMVEESEPRTETLYRTQAMRKSEEYLNVYLLV